MEFNSGVNIFLPGSNGLYDPITDPNTNSSRSQTSMTLEEQDRLCYTSQTLLRALAIHPKYVLGIENGPDIFAGPCQWNEISFTPSEPGVFDYKSNGQLTTDPQQSMLVEVN